MKYSVIDIRKSIEASKKIGEHWAVVHNFEMHKTTQDRLNWEKYKSIVKPALMQVLGWKRIRKDAKLVAVAGHTGNFVRALKQIGFNIEHTDISKKFVEIARSKGLESREAPAQRIPYKKGNIYHIGFEIDPVIRSEAAEVMFLRTMLQTNGLILAGSIPQPFLDHLAKKYECKIEKLMGRKDKDKGVIIERYEQRPVLNNSKEGDEFHITKITPTEKSLPKIWLDLKLLKLLQNKKEISISKLSKRLGIKEDKIKRSLGRIFVHPLRAKAKEWVYREITIHK